MCVCVSARMHVCVHVYMCVHMYMCVFMSRHVCVYMFTILPQLMARAFISFQQLFIPATKRDQ